MKTQLVAILAAAGLLGTAAQANTQDQLKKDQKELNQQEQKVDQAREKLERDARQERLEAKAHAKRAQREIQGQAPAVRAESQAILQKHEDKTERADGLKSGGSGSAGLSPTLQGTLRKASNKELTLRDFQGRELKFKVDSQTRAERNGQRMALSQLKEGERVRTSFIVRNHELVARDVQVTQPAIKR